MNTDDLLLLAQDLAEDVDVSYYRKISQGRSYWALPVKHHDVSAWVISWADGFDSETGYHDHDESNAAIVVVDGAVVEERLTLADPPVVHYHHTGQSFVLPASAIHSVRHNPRSDMAAITVHAYSPPLIRQGVYRRSDDGSIHRDVVLSTSKIKAHRLRES